MLGRQDLPDKIPVGGVRTQPCEVVREVPGVDPDDTGPALYDRYVTLVDQPLYELVEQPLPLHPPTQIRTWSVHTDPSRAACAAALAASSRANAFSWAAVSAAARRSAIRV